MVEIVQEPETVFIFGSPRSGTTILENILNCHNKIAEWYEPYYLWESYFPVFRNDIWDENLISDKIRSKIRSEFNLYRKKVKKPIIVDKLPTHAFNLKIICNIFPDAKYIHLLRDGRDTTLSIKKEWGKRAAIINHAKIGKFIKLSYDMLKRQQFWRYRLMAISYEISSRRLSLNPRQHLNKSKWKGFPGWGPRFNNWEEYLQTHSTIAFNAMQWVQSVQAVLNSWPILPQTNRMEIRYEDLIRSPEKTLSRIMKFIGVNAEKSFFSRIPVLDSTNLCKWKTELSAEKIAQIKPILSPLLDKLSYTLQFPW